MKEKTPTISVIVPVYNTAAYVERCARSVLSQTFADIELLLVDDGSSDESGRLCDRLAKEDERVRVFHKENGGSSSARNCGLLAARGAYIGFVDSDDTIEPEMYEKLLSALKRSGEGYIAQIGRDELSEDGGCLPPICVPPSEELYTDAETFLKTLLLHLGDSSFCTKLTPRAFFAAHRFPEGVLNEDFRLLLALLQEIKGVVSLPCIGYHVLYRAGSNTRAVSGAFSRAFADAVDNADFAAELVREKYPSLLPVSARFCLYQRLEYLLHIPIAQMTRKNRRYASVVSYLRGHIPDTLFSRYLTAKNKLYLLLLTIAPAGVRKAHRFWMLRRNAQRK